jgi:predicted nucleotidyltransferase
MRTLEITDPLLAEIVRRLVEAYRPERIYLFGSHARGQVGPNSDYGVMVVLPDDAPRERRQSRLAYQVLRGTGIAADVLVTTRSAFERRLSVPASLPATIEREGAILMAHDPALVDETKGWLTKAATDFTSLRSPRRGRVAPCSGGENARPRGQARR